MTKAEFLDFVPVVIVTMPDSNNHPQVFSVHDDWNALRDTIIEAFDERPSPSGKVDPARMNGVSIRLGALTRHALDSLPEWMGW